MHFFGCKVQDMDFVRGIYMETIISYPRPNFVNFGALYPLNSMIGGSLKPTIDDVNSNSRILPGKFDFAWFK